jgi:hypothetical protein
MELYLHFEWGYYFNFFFFYYLVCEAIGTATTPGLLCQPQVTVKMIVEKQMECRMAGETKVLGENLPQRHFCPSQNSTWPDPSSNPGRRGGTPATNRLSYGAAHVNQLLYHANTYTNIEIPLPMRVVSSLAKQLLTSQGGLCCKELVN